MPWRQVGIFLLVYHQIKPISIDKTMVKAVQSQWSSGHYFNHHLTVFPSVQSLAYLLACFWTVPTPTPQEGVLCSATGLCSALVAVQSLWMRLPCLGRKMTKHGEAWGATSCGCRAREQSLPILPSNSYEVMCDKVFSWFCQESLLFSVGYFVHSWIDKESNSY